MADQKISELPAADPLDGTEDAPVVQAGQTRKASDLATRTWVGEQVDNATTVVQTVMGTSTVDDATTSSSWTDTSLEVSITPKFADSIIVVRATGRLDIRRIAGTREFRFGGYRLRNVTDGVNLTGASDVREGRVLVAASSVSAPSFHTLSLLGRFTVSSTATRTFRVQHAAFQSPDVQSELAGATSTALIVAQEVRP